MTAFLLQSVTNVFTKRNDFIRKYFRTGADMQTLAGNLISAVIWEKVLLEYRYTQISFPTAGLWWRRHPCDLGIMSGPRVAFNAGCWERFKSGAIGPGIFQRSRCKNVSLKLVLSRKLVVHLFYDNIANPYFNSIKVVTPLFSFCFVLLCLLCFVLFFKKRWIQVIQ